MLIWLMGLSGSGKTTTGQALVGRLRPKYPNIFFLDGDSFRAMFGHDLGHSLDARYRNNERISNFCHEMDRQGIHVVLSAMSLFPEWRERNRARMSGYFEVYLDISLDVLEARDTKGIYTAFRAGRETNVAGIDLPFPAPAAPDVTISAEDQKAGVEQCVDIIMAKLPL